MGDRLTQLQICLDQLIEQFNAAINYININSEPALLDEDPKSVINMAAQPQTQAPDTEAPPSHPKPNFTTTLNELSRDIILKSRQITMLIDALPGVGVDEELQIELIKRLSMELTETEKRRIQKIKEKDELLEKCQDLIVEVAKGIHNTNK